MNKQLRTFLIVIGAIIIAGASLTYGALTAPGRTTTVTTTPPTPSASVTPTPTTPPVSSTPLDPKAALQTQLPAITTVLTSTYPKITTDYTINGGTLYENGRWFGTTLTYRGADTLNRDTLRVLMEKKNGSWTLRTTPPEMILSAKKYPDVPVAVLKAINKPISLP